MTDDPCQCPAAGWCERRQAAMPAIHWRKCQAGKGRGLDNLYSTHKPHREPAPDPARKSIPRSTLPDVSTIGTQIQRAIEAAIGAVISCGACLSFLRSLNQRTEHNHEVLVDELYRIGLPIPADIRAKHKGPKLRAWISATISEVVPKLEPVVISSRSGDPSATQFVWVYWHGGANGDEIRWSVRSVERFFLGAARCLIVGDRPPWYTGEMITVPRISQAADQKTFRPGLRDVLHKMQVIATSPQVADEFVWMMDDIYFLRPFTLDDLRIPRGTGWREDKSNAWQRVKCDTMSRLAAEGLPQYDYATHLPHVVEKQKLQAVMTDYQLHRCDMLWENLYGNRYRSSPVSSGPFLYRLQKKMPAANIRSAISNATVLNNDVGAWGPAMRQVLSEILPTPASVESGDVGRVRHFMIIQASYADLELSRRRLAIARHTSIASLAYQTAKPIIHIACNPSDPYYAERIAAYESTGCSVRVLDRQTWNLYRENWELPEGRKIVSRMDDDDVICREYCERIQEQSPEAGECAMIWPNGYVFWRQQIFQLHHPGIQFVSLVTDGMRDPHQEQHWIYHKTWPSKIVSHNVGWIWVRHGDAATSTLPRYRKHHRRAIDANRIPINLRAIVRAIEESGQASGDYHEHRNQQTLKHVLKENAAHGQ